MTLEDTLSYFFGESLDTLGKDHRDRVEHMARALVIRTDECDDLIKKLSCAKHQFSTEVWDQAFPGFNIGGALKGNSLASYLGWNNPENDRDNFFVKLPYLPEEYRRVFKSMANTLEIYMDKIQELKNEKAKPEE